jgi:hypothetical protein
MHPPAAVVKSISTTTPFLIVKETVDYAMTPGGGGEL